MPTRSDRARHLQGGNGPMSNGEGLPPSTYAAQIVENYGKAAVVKSQRDYAGIGQLLENILEAEQRTNAIPGGIETDLEANHSLIYTLSRHLLELFHHSDPFFSKEARNVQVLNCLSVIDLTIRKLPSVLFVSSERKLPQGPLLLWILPQLTNLILLAERESSGRIVQKTTSLVRNALLSRHRLTNARGRRCSGVHFVQQCVEEILRTASLEFGSLDRGARLLTIRRARIPTVEIAVAFLPPSLYYNELYPIPCFDFQDLHHLLFVVIHLLDFTLPEQKAVQSVAAPTRGACCFRWIISILPQISIPFNYLRSSSTQSSAERVAFFSTSIGFFYRLFASASNAGLDVADARLIVTGLADSLTAVLQDPLVNPTQELQSLICRSLIEFYTSSTTSPVISVVYHSQLVPFLQAFRESNDQINNLCEDLKYIVSVFACLSPDGLPKLATYDSLQNGFEDGSLNGYFTAVILATDRLRSKRETNESAGLASAASSWEAEAIEGVATLLRVAPSTVPGQLALTMKDSFERLSNDHQCRLLDTIGEIACARGSQLEERDAKSGCSPARCASQPYVHSDNLESARRPLANVQDLIIPIIEILPYLQKQAHSRVAAMRAAQRLLAHSDNTDHLNMRNSVLGQWCLQAIHSSLRDLRIAASQTLPAFLNSRVAPETMRSNLVAVMEKLRMSSNKSDLYMQESCILALGCLAESLDGDAVNLVLAELLEFLSHENGMIASLAYDELLKVCGHSALEARSLFTPFWSSIAPMVVKDLETRPLAAQRMCDLLNHDLPSFLIMTEKFTIPYLVLTKKRDVLEQIVRAHGPAGDMSSLLLDPEILTAILAYLLLQSSPNVEGLTVALLQEALQTQELDFLATIHSISIPLTVELLKIAGERDEATRIKAHQAIIYLATQTTRRPTSTTSRRNEIIPIFFEQNVLGIVTTISEAFTGIKVPQTVREKARSLGAIREMIKLAKSHLTNGLQQILVNLRASMEEPELCNHAFQVWILLLRHLEEEDVEPLVDPTFAIIAQSWDLFNSTVQEESYEIISYLLSTHSNLIREMVNTIPSLASVPAMKKFEEDLNRFRAQLGTRQHLQAFCQRCQDDNSDVVTRALVELEACLQDHRDFLHAIAISEQPDPIVAQLIRSILDACVRFSESNSTIAVLCGKCLGHIGCLDPTRIEVVREVKNILVLSNFVKEDETVEFVLHLLKEVLVPVFLSVKDTRSQTFLGYAMQELLKFCHLDVSATARTRDLQPNDNYRRWVALPESIRNTLTPFLTSKLVLKAAASLPEDTYPIFRKGQSHSLWLRTFVVSLLRRGHGNNATSMFKICLRVIGNQDISISVFLLPYVALNVVMDGSDELKANIANEFLLVLSQELPDNNHAQRAAILSSSQAIFRVLDYFSQWMQEKKKEFSQLKASFQRTANASSQLQIQYETMAFQIGSVESVLKVIPVRTISNRAVDCGSYSRALYYWEKYMRERKEINQGDEKETEKLYEKLQRIYTQIDEPDGVEGISSFLQVLDIDQQVLEHQKAGRYATVQSWFETSVHTRPDDLRVKRELLLSLRDSGQHDVILNQVDAFETTQAINSISLPIAAEASWVTSRWDKLADYVTKASLGAKGEFNIEVGSALLALQRRDQDSFFHIINELRSNITKSLTIGTTSSLLSCHEAMLRLHVLTEVELISGFKPAADFTRPSLLTTLDRRLDILGAFSSGKQYLLGLRRAAIELSNFDLLPVDVSSTWLTSARLLRKEGFTRQAFSAVLKASQLGDHQATLEHSRLLWKEGQHRKAIRSLEGAIAADAFQPYDFPITSQKDSNAGQKNQPLNLVKARANLLLAKWMDRAGHTRMEVVIACYHQAVDTYNRWEKGHYHLGKHYNKLLESETAKPPAKQAQYFFTGEMAKLVIENYLRSIVYGAQYLYQTLPRILTLWLELGANVDKPPDLAYGNDETFRRHTILQKRKMFESVSNSVKKYVDRLPAFVFYTAFAQILARICHANNAVYASLQDIIVKVVTTHSQQALWALLATVKSSAKDRSHRGTLCLHRITEGASRLKSETAGVELRAVVNQGTKLSDQLLRVCEVEVHGKSNTVSLSRDLGFNHKSAPCRLAIPLESTLTAALPPVADTVSMRSHKAFSKDTVTISTFLEDVLVLNSLQRPRRISIRGSDGNVYNLLCKPKDDLRKDQRLMEFNSMINRALKKDSESSRRRLYIKTYAVTPLNEECGLIEWIDNLKTLRDILLRHYRQKSIGFEAGRIRAQLDEASSDFPNNVPLFRAKLLTMFPPIFHEWFVETFTEPSRWFNARLKYTRSCAVMSVVGHVLGLGDRHGENILFEEDSGGTLHVDFNCLFDKGLTFEKPELVPFRLTPNMIDAMGAYGYEGPFRRSCELSLGIVRQFEDTLMTILETFLWDPTTDFLGKRRKGAGVPGVPNTPEEVLESVRGKVRGYLAGESVPLSVEGYVQNLIEKAVDEGNLCRMYIGWCPFF